MLQEAPVPDDPFHVTDFEDQLQLVTTTMAGKLLIVDNTASTTDDRHTHGLGMQIDTSLTVTFVDEGGQAIRGGVEVGDVITSMNGESMTGKSDADAVSILTTSKAKNVDVQIEFNGGIPAPVVKVTVTEEKRQAKRRGSCKGQSIALDELLSDKELAELDENHDGIITSEEVRHFIKQSHKSKNSVIWLRKALGLAILLLVVFAGTIIGFTIAAIEGSKESHVEHGVNLDLNGNVVQTANSDMMTLPDGRMVKRDPENGSPVRRLQDGEYQPILTGSSGLTAHSLTSKVPDRYLVELKYFMIEEDGNQIMVKVETFSRTAQQGAHCGMVVTLHTSHGDFTLDHEHLYHPTLGSVAVEGAFDAERRLEASFGRRLSIEQLQAFYNFVEESDFTCEMIWKQETFEKKLNTLNLPMSMVQYIDHSCTDADGGDLCSSSLGSHKPGVRPDGKYITEVVEILITENTRIEVSHLPSHPLQAQVTVMVRNVSSGNTTKTWYQQYNALDAPKMTKKSRVWCSQESAKAIPHSVDPYEDSFVSYLGETHEEYRGNVTKLRRWAVTPKSSEEKDANATSPPTAGGRLTSELWETIADETPYRFFLTGDAVAELDIPDEENRLFGVADGLSEQETDAWVNSRLFFNMSATQGLSCHGENDIKTSAGAASAVKPPALTGKPWEENEMNVAFYAARMQDHLGTMAHWMPLSYQHYWETAVSKYSTEKEAATRREEQLEAIKSQSVTIANMQAQLTAMRSAIENHVSGSTQTPKQQVVDPQEPDDAPPANLMEAEEMVQTLGLNTTNGAPSTRRLVEIGGELTTPILTIGAAGFTLSRVVGLSNAVSPDATCMTAFPQKALEKYFPDFVAGRAATYPPDTNHCPGSTCGEVGQYCTFYVKYICRPGILWSTNNYWSAANVVGCHSKESCRGGAPSFSWQQGQTNGGCGPQPLGLKDFPGYMSRIPSYCYVNPVDRQRMAVMTADAPGVGWNKDIGELVGGGFYHYKAAPHLNLITWLQWYFPIMSDVIQITGETHIHHVRTTHLKTWLTLFANQNYEWHAINTYGYTKDQYDVEKALAKAWEGGWHDAEPGGKNHEWIKTCFGCGLWINQWKMFEAAAAHYCKPPWSLTYKEGLKADFSIPVFKYGPVMFLAEGELAVGYQMQSNGAVPAVGCNEALSGHLQTGYSGCQNTAVDGTTCRQWTGYGCPNNLCAHNYCRNPDYDTGGIWCFKEGGGWAYCNPKGE
jgi:hypothetical protein